MTETKDYEKRQRLKLEMYQAWTEGNYRKVRKLLREYQRLTSEPLENQLWPNARVLDANH